MPYATNEVVTVHPEHASNDISEIALEVAAGAGQAETGQPGAKHSDEDDAHCAPRACELGQLLARCAGDDRAAFEQLYRLTSRRLHILAERMLAHSHGAEEVVQESYLKIWHRAGQFDARRGAPMTWMINVVRHQALDIMRRPEHRITQAQPLEDETVDHQPIGHWRDPASELHRQRALAHVYGGAEDEKKRLCLELVYQRGYSLAQAAEALDLPVSTAKTWAARSVARARAHFGVCE